MEARATWSCREVAMPDLGSFSDVERWWRWGSSYPFGSWVGPWWSWATVRKRERLRLELGRRMVRIDRVRV
jgi:hypothetical protein